MSKTHVERIKLSSLMLPTVKTINKVSNFSLNSKCHDHQNRLPICQIAIFDNYSCQTSVECVIVQFNIYCSAIELYHLFPKIEEVVFLIKHYR